MNPLLILEDALKSGKDFGSLAGKLRDKFKSGVSDLQAIFDEAEDVVDKAIAKAKDGLAAFKTEVSKVEGEISDVGNEMPAEAAPTAPVEPEAPVEPVVSASPVVTEAPSGAVVTVDSVVAATTHEAADGTVTVLPHDGTDAHAHDAAMQPAEVKPEAVQEAVQATVDAGVAMPEKSEALAAEAAPVI